MKHFEDLKNLINAIENDVHKFGNGNHAAGTRVRKGLQDIKNAAQAMRIHIQETKNSIK